MEAALAIIGGLFSGVKVAGLTIPELITIAQGLYSAEPEIKSLVIALHPLFADLVESLSKGATPEEAAHQVGPNYISGYAPDGSVIEIPNPDAQ